MYVCNNDEGGREETSRKAQTAVDGPSVERFETTPARSKARTEPRSMEKGSHGERPRTTRQINSSIIDDLLTSGDF